MSLDDVKKIIKDDLIPALLPGNCQVWNVSRWTNNKKIIRVLMHETIKARTSAASTVVDYGPVDTAEDLVHKIIKKLELPMLGDGYALRLLDGDRARLRGLAAGFEHDTAGGQKEIDPLTTMAAVSTAGSPPNARPKKSG